MAAPLGSFPQLTSSVLNRDVAQLLPLQQTFLAPAAILSLLKTVMYIRAQPQATSNSTQSTNVIPTLSPTSTTVNVAPASVPPPPVMTQAPILSLSTVIITTILTPEALSATTTPPVTALQPAAPYTTVFTESLLHTFTTSSPPPGTPRASGAAAGNTGNLGTNGGVPKITSRSSSARASATNAVTSSPSLRSHHVSKSDIGRYTGMAIGAVFVLTLISSFFSAWWKHRKYVRTRPRGSIFVGTKLSDGQHSPQKRSMSQILMHSVSDSSFDAYAMSNTPPTTPASVSFMPSSPHSGSQQSHLDLNRGRAFSPSPVPIRPLPPTPSPKYAMHEEDTIFYAHTPPLDPRGFSPFGASPPGQILADPRSGWHMPGGDHQ